MSIADPAPSGTSDMPEMGVDVVMNGNGVNGGGAGIPALTCTPTDTDPTPASVQLALEEAEDDAPLSGDDTEARILRQALEWAVAHADVELVGYLAGLEGRLGTILDTQVAALEDDEGWGIVGMAIQSSCGLSDKEEAVRLIVARWGVSAGPRGGRDNSGWTALHLAALLSSPQTVSVLLNRGASPAALTDGGLSAYDLITGMEGREPLALLLDPLHDDAPASEAIGCAADRPPLSPRRRELIQRRRFRDTTRNQLEERRAVQARITAERERWVRERAKNIGVNASVLFPEPKEVEEEEERDGDDDDEGDDSEEFLNPSNALVFSLNQLGFIFDIFITKYSPLCQPQERRALPANALYLYARFAHYQCDEAWLEELVDGAIERIERGVYSNGDDLAYLAFWEYNLTLLLGLIRLDEPLFKACTEMNLLGMVEELINAIHVFVIRIAERKIDEVLDAAMLDYESLEDFEDVRFTDQWNLFRSFTSRKKTRDTPLAASVFSAPATPDRPDPLESPHRTTAGMPSPSPHRATAAGIPSPSPSSTGRSLLDLKAEAREVIATGIEKAGQVVGLGGDKPSPSRIVDTLTNVLLILQLYDVNPAFIVQVFSQTFYWISSELFNRIITRRKYLCRSKAVQIRMNITALEDWTRQNGLPPNIATKHLEPVMQLLQWLQCLSQINQFDMLIGTVQNLRALNPLQMRRAVRDYRFEVNESRMADDCVQYLAQMQKDWERRRVHMGAKNAQQSQRAADADDPLSIEALFDGSVGIGEWVPQTLPECLGELVDSRFMLPFLIPTSTEFLLATPPPDEAYRNLTSELPLLPDGTTSSRPLSRASYSSSRPMAWASQHEKRVRRLPEHFFKWLKERQAEFVREWGAEQGAERKKKKTDVKVTPTRPAPPPPIPDSSKPVPSPPLPALPEQYATPNKALPRAPDSPESRRSRELARKASVDLGQQTAHEATPPGTDSIEMVFRPSPSPATYANGPYAIPAVDLGRRLSNGSSVASPSSGSPHYELARLRRERKASVSSVHSNSSASGEKKRWWKLGRGSDGDTSFERERERRRAEREDTAETIVPSPSARRTSTSETVKTLVSSPVRNTQSIYETEEEIGRSL